MCGTLDYLSPEIFSEKTYNNLVDWFSLGCLIYEILVGRIHFEIHTEEDLEKIVK